MELHVNILLRTQYQFVLDINKISGNFILTSKMETSRNSSQKFRKIFFHFVILNSLQSGLNMSKNKKFFW